jgi:hypothetical protein
MSLLPQFTDKKNVIIYGSGEMGIVVRRVIEADNKGQYRVKCYVMMIRKYRERKSMDILYIHDRY